MNSPYVVRSQRSGWLQVTVYAGTVCGTPAPDPAEVSDWRWFTEGEVPEVIAGDHRTRLTDWWAGRTVALPARSSAPG